MILKIIYFAFAAGALGLLLFEAPSGALLTGSPASGKVTKAAAPTQAAGTTTTSPLGPAARAATAVALWSFVAGSSGGYQGGK